MKVYILHMALVLALAVVQSESNEEIQKIDMNCRAETRASEDEIKGFFSGDKKDEPQESLKCYLKCLMEKHGHWKNGAFDMPAALKQAEDIPHLKDHQEAIKKAFEKCKDKKGVNECDTAYLIIKCSIDYHSDNM